MKKIILGVAFSMICFSGFSQEDTWIACGQEDVKDILTDMSENFCPGTYYILDACNGDNLFVVDVEIPGPNSSCGGLPVE